MNLVIVDMQPCYAPICDPYMARAVRALKKAKDAVMFWVGFGLSEDTFKSVAWYWLEHGASRKDLEKVSFIEKDYGFLREWMDDGVDHTATLNVLKYMLKHGITITEDIPKEELYALCKQASPFQGWAVKVPEDSRMMLPQFDVSRLQGKEWDICGGAKHECLAEIELLLEAHEVKTNRLHDIVWG